MPKLADIKTCTGCLACVDICPQNALSSCYNCEGHLSYLINESLCIDCGLCEKKCPVVSGFNYGKNVLNESIPYAAWSKDEYLRAKSTSGGIFASLAKYIIEQGGVAIGAHLQNNEVHHIAIDCVDDIYKLQGSKYTQSNTDGIYKIVTSYLKDGRDVLFSGLGCQVAGMLSYIGSKHYPGKLYTVDLICGGVPSRFIIDKYLQNNDEVKEIVSFRNKGRYEFSIIDKRGCIKVVPIKERPFPLCGFYTELTHRYSCYDCKFNGAHRKSDMTIGDYWGDTEYREEHLKGISVAVAHTFKGNELLMSSGNTLHRIGWRDFLAHNPRMIDGVKTKYKSKERKYLANAFRSESYDELLRKYANKASWKQPFTMIKKIFRYVKGLLEKRLYLIKLNRLIKSYSIDENSDNHISLF